MRINLDLAKIYYSYLISNDTDIPGCIVRNSTIPEELGRIQFVLTDKTGTLTQNDMIFKKVSMEFAHFSEESIHELKELLLESLRES
jgi:phospholipid-translocating ATPase